MLIINVVLSTNRLYLTAHWLWSTTMEIQPAATWAGKTTVLHRIHILTGVHSATATQYKAQTTNELQLFTEPSRLNTDAEGSLYNYGYDVCVLTWFFFCFVFIFRCDKHVFRNIRVASQLQVKLRKLTAHQDPTISGPYVWQVKYFLISRDNTQLPRFPDRSNFWQITWYLSNFASWISTAQELDWYRTLAAVCGISIYSATTKIWTVNSSGTPGSQDCRIITIYSFETGLH